METLNSSEENASAPRTICRANGALGYARCQFYAVLENQWTGTVNYRRDAKEPASHLTWTRSFQ